VRGWVSKEVKVDVMGEGKEMTHLEEVLE